MRFRAPARSHKLEPERQFLPAPTVTPVRPRSALAPCKSATPAPPDRSEQAVSLIMPRSPSTVLIARRSPMRFRALVRLHRLEPERQFLPAPTVTPVRPRSALALCKSATLAPPDRSEQAVSLI